jgi:pimeloyl-ACP methyl ester carboxylesterase
VVLLLGAALVLALLAGVVALATHHELTRSFLRCLRYLLAAELVLLIILAVVGVIYEKTSSSRDQRLHPPPGKLIDIGGYRLHLLCAGEGSPTVVLDYGLVGSYLEWRLVQSEVARLTRVCAYDRAGYGWSDRSPKPRTPEIMTNELHTLLEKAGEKPPFILVGHSFGGLVVRRYALSYPEDVAGVVLVDPMRCEEWPPLDPSKQSQINLGRRLIRYAVPIAYCGVTRLAVRSAFRRAGKPPVSSNPPQKIGGRHVIQRIKQEVGKMPREVWPVVAAHWSRPSFYAGMRSHISSIPDTVREMYKAEPIRDIPVCVLTPGNSTPLSESCLRSIGTNVHQVIAEESEHWIHLDEPELVISAIRQMLATATPEPVGIIA